MPQLRSDWNHVELLFAGGLVWAMPPSRWFSRRASLDRFLNQLQTCSATCVRTGTVIRRRAEKW